MLKRSSRQETKENKDMFHSLTNRVADQPSSNWETLLYKSNIPLCAQTIGKAAQRILYAHGKRNINPSKRAGDVIGREIWKKTRSSLIECKSELSFHNVFCNSAHNVVKAYYSKGESGNIYARLVIEEKVDENEARPNNSEENYSPIWKSVKNR